MRNIAGSDAVFKIQVNSHGILRSYHLKRPLHGDTGVRDQASDCPCFIISLTKQHRTNYLLVLHRLGKLALAGWHTFLRETKTAPKAHLETRTQGLRWKTLLHSWRMLKKHRQANMRNENLSRICLYALHNPHKHAQERISTRLATSTTDTQPHVSTGLADTIDIRFADIISTLIL